MQRALLIEVDYQTGRRAGGINPSDPELQCYGWQNTPNQEGEDLEIRLIEDDRDISQYEGVDGITILEGREEINEAIKEIVPPAYSVVNRELYEMTKEETDIDINEIPERRSDMIKFFYERDDIRGIEKREPDLL